MKISELRELSGGELSVKVASMEKDLFMMKFQHGIRQLDNTAKLASMKKDIARVKTIMMQKQHNNG